MRSDNTRRKAAVARGGDIAYVAGMRKLLAAVCTVAIVIAAACSKSPSKPPNAEAKPPAPETIGELRAEIAKSLGKYHVPGCGFALVARDHVIYSGGVGKADIAAGRDVTRRHHVQGRIDHQRLRRAVAAPAS